MAVSRPKVQVDLRPYYKGEERGHSDKHLIVLHETVSYDQAGVGDIKGVASFMDAGGLEIHGIVDIEANSAWCYDPTAVYDHAASGSGNVNTRSIGFEQVSNIPLLHTNAERVDAWRPTGPRKKQLNKVAEWIAFLHGKVGIPFQYSEGVVAGITSHWDVSQTFLGSGHWDCKPVHKGGHYPILYVINKAEQIWKYSEL